MSDDAELLKARTIADFGEQWTHFKQNEGHYASTALLADMLGPLLALNEISGKQVAEIGSGTGRIVQMLVACGAEHVTALEPSAACAALRENTKAYAAKVTIVQNAGDRLPRNPPYDLVFCIGVLHHIPDPAPVVAAARAALKPGGKLVVWLYGYEGNRFYLALVTPLRAMTTRLPHGLCMWISGALNGALDVYMLVCRFVRLPLRDYLQQVFVKFDRETRRLVIYDQLNPAYAKYYREGEVRALLNDAGFTNIQLHHRHGYSWSAVAAG